MELLSTHHDVFALEEGERGETNRVEMTIDTDDTHPIQQPVRRMSFTVRREVAKQLRKMQDNGVLVPFCGVPEALLTDRGANLLSHLMTVVCKLLGIKNLNTTSYHPQCDGLVERFNHTLKAPLRKHTVTFGD